MNRWTRRLLGILVIAIVAIALRLTIWREHAIPVEVFAVERGRVESTVVNSRAGTVESRLQAEMSPGIAGLVESISAEKGTTVRAGQTLLEIDAAEHRANARLAERSLEAARATAQEAHLDAEQTDRELVRVQGLAARNLASDRDLEDAQTRAEVARIEAIACDARAAQAMAALDLARATLAKATMRAPFDGVVLDVRTEVGEWISPSPPGVMIPAVVDVIAPDSLYVNAPIDESDVAALRVGQRCRITLDAYRDRAFDGRVVYIASFVETSQEQNRTLEVEATFLDAQLPENLLPGLSADVEIVLDVHEGVLRVPSFAFLEGDVVLVVDGNRLVARDVQTGLRNWEFVEVLDGLSEGDRVVTSLDRAEVRAGARIEVIEHSLVP